MSAELTVKVREGMGRNEGTENEYKVQMVDLENQDGKIVARIEAYPGNGFYSAYWIATLPPDQLVALAEKSLVHYDTKYADGVKGVDGKITVPSGVDRDRSDADIMGVISCTKNNSTDEGKRNVDLTYERPLSWERVKQSAGGDELTFARFNTPIADFCVMLADEDGFNFGFLSHLGEMDGFVNLLSESTREVVTPEKAKEFFDAMLALYPQLSSNT